MSASRSLFLSFVLLALLSPAAVSAGTQTFSTPGTHTFTVPNYTGSLTVEAWGGGGGGQFCYSMPNGKFSYTRMCFLGIVGSPSSFGSITAYGGNAGGGPAGSYYHIKDYTIGGGPGGTFADGTATGGDVNLSGEPGSYCSNGVGGGGGSGLDPVGTRHGVAPGGGGDGHCQGAAALGGGGAGYAKKTYPVGALTPGSTQTVMVGAGGAKGGNTSAGPGAPGRVTITWGDAPVGTCPVHSHGTFPNCVCDAGYTSNGLTGSSLVCTPQTQPQPQPQTTGLSCSITTAQNPITSGDSTQLNWSSTGSPTAFFVNSMGWVAGSGSTSVAPQQTTNYSGTVYKCPADYTLSADGTQCSKTTQAQVTTGTGGSKSFAGPSWGSGASTFTVPPYGSLTVEVWGGGGMSSASLYDPNGAYCTQFQPAGYCDIEHSNGGRSSWNGSVIANGGQHATTVMSPASSYYNAMGGAGGTASGGDVNTVGEAGHQAPPGGDGRGGKTAGNPPTYSLSRYGDGGGNPALGNGGAGGGAGGYAKKTYTPGQLTVGASIPVVAGHQGVMTVWALAGGYGNPGLVKVTWIAPSSSASTGGTTVVPSETAQCSVTLTVNCAPGSHWDPMVNQCITDSQECLPGEHWDESLDQCVVDSQQCPVGSHWNGTACVNDLDSCPAGQIWDATAGACVSYPGASCLPGTYWNGSICITDTCPTSQHFNGTTCVNDNCLPGQHWHPGQQRCVADNCPVGQHWSDSVHACIDNNCPAGQTWNGNGCACPSGTVWYQNQCQVGMCVPGYQCGQDGNVYRQDLQCNLTLHEACQWGCTDGACNAPPEPQVVTWKVTPSVLAKGKATSVSWDVRNVTSCTVSGTNGDSWTGAQGTKTSSPIQGQTTYKLHCVPFTGASWTDRTAVVNVLPVFQER